MSQTSPNSSLIKIAEAARILGVHKDTLRRWEKSGKIQIIRHSNGTRLYDISQLTRIAVEKNTLPTTGQLLATTSINQKLRPEINFGRLPQIVSIQTSQRHPKKLVLLGGFLACLAIITFGIIGYLKQPLPLSSKMQKADKNVLAATTGNVTVKINASERITGSLIVDGSINGMKLAVSPETGTGFTLSANEATISTQGTIKLDQDVSTTAAPAFTGLTLSSSANPLVVGGLKFNLPSNSTTLAGTDSTQTLTNKTISGSSNTLTNIPNSSLTNSKVTVTAGTNLTGGGDVSLGSSVTVSVKDSISLSGTLGVSGAATLTSASLSIAGISYTFPSTQGSASTVLTENGSGALTWSSISLSSAGGWADDGTIVRLITSTDNVGIGTSAPAYNLDVSGNVGISGSLTLNLGSDATGDIFYRNSTGAISRLAIGSAGQALIVTSGLPSWGTGSQWTTSGNNIYFSGAAGSGNVGIGNTYPNYAKLQLTGSGTGTGITFQTLDSSGTQRFSILDNGNVGIGTTAPGSQLEIANSSTASILALNYSALPGSSGFGAIAFNSKTTPNSWTTPYSSTANYRSSVFDSFNGVLYWGTVSTTLVRCAISTNCDASGDFTTYTMAKGNITGMVYDATNKILYATVGSTKGVFRCDTTSGCTSAGNWTEVYTPVNGIDALEIDTTNQVLYGVGGSGNAAIIRCVLSTGCTAAGNFTLFNPSVPNNLQSVVIDTVNGAIYTTGTTSALGKCLLSTTCSASGNWTNYASILPGTTTFNALTIDTTNGYIYTGTNDGDIYRCLLSTGCTTSGNWTLAYDSTQARFESIFYDSQTTTLFAGSGTNGYIYSCDVTTDCTNAQNWILSTDTTDADTYTITKDTTGNILYAGGVSVVSRKSAPGSLSNATYAKIEGAAPNVTGSTATGAIIFKTLATGGSLSEVMRVQDQYVGIGTITPAYLLDVAATSGRTVNISNVAGTGVVYGLYTTISGATGSGSRFGASLNITGGGGAVSTGLEIGNISSSTTTGITIGNLSGTTSDTGLEIGNISGSGATGTGIAVGTISTTGTTNYGLRLSTLTGGTTSNYQISTGLLTSATTSTNAQINLGGIVTTGGTTNYGINVGSLSGTGTTNTALNISAITSTGTSTGIAIGAMSGAGTTNYGLYVGSISGASNNYAAVFAGGNVGIGTTGPGSTLTVIGNVGIGTTNVGASLQVNGGGVFWPLTTAVSAPSFGLAVSGNVGIGTSSPTSKLHIVGGNCVDDASGGGCTADYAELYPSTEDVEKGDLLVIDTDSQGNVKRSTTPYQKTIMGIVSTAPAIIIEGSKMNMMNNEYVLDPGKPAVALAGRVPLKVSLENGPIEAGDYLTSSSTPGVAMKAIRAGPIVGKALEAFPNTSEESGSTSEVEFGKILAFLEVGFADPGNFLASLSLDPDGNLITPKIKVDKLLITDDIDLSNANPDSQLSYEAGSTNNGTSFGNLPALDVLASLKNLDQSLMDVKTKQATDSANITDLAAQLASASAVIASTAKQSQEIATDLSGLRDDVDNLNLTPPEILLATGSAELASLTTSEATVSGQLTAYNLDIQNSLKSLGETTLGKTTIAGDLTVDGTFGITTGNTINAIPILFLQNSPLTTKVDLFNGLVTITNDGLVTAKTIQADKLILGASTLGSGIVKANSTETIIETASITEKSKIFVTSQTEIDMPLFVGDKITGTSFTVKIKTALPYDVLFDWSVIDNK